MNVEVTGPLSYKETDQEDDKTKYLKNAYVTAEEIQVVFPPKEEKK